MSREKRARRSQHGGEPTRRPGTTRPRQTARLPAFLQRQIEDIYLQMDAQLTRLAEIQLQFDELRSKIRQL